MCPALCDPIDCSPPGSSIHGILQGRILEWVAISFSRAGLPYPEIKPEFPALAGGFFAIESPGKPLKWVCVFSCVRLFATPWAVARWPPLSMGFSRQEYWRGLPCLPPGDLPDPEIELGSPSLAGGFLTSSTTWEAHLSIWWMFGFPCLRYSVLDLFPTTEGPVGVIYCHANTMRFDPK